MPDAVADVLAEFRGKLALRDISSLTHVKLAAKLAEERDELNLPLLSELPDGVAAILSRSKAMLLLPGLKSISNFDLAWRLFQQERDSYPLSFLKSITEEQAAIIASCKEDVYLDEVATVSESVAGILSNHRATLGLRGLKNLSASALERLKGHRGNLILPANISVR